MQKAYGRRVAVLAASIILVLGVLAYVGVSRQFLDWNGTGNGKTTVVEIEAGSTMGELAPTLVEKGVVKKASFFIAAANNTSGASNVKPGFYRLQEHMSAQAAVDALLDPANKVMLLQIAGSDTLEDVAVIGGSVRQGIFAKIPEVTCANATQLTGDKACVSKDELRQVAATVDPASLGVPSWATAAVLARGNDPKRLEGLIMPGEYIVDPEANATEILKQLVSTSATELANAGIETRGQAANLGPYQLLTLASIVEREGTSKDFDKVARVLLNRLAQGMKLQCDSTVNYGLVAQEVATTTADRQRETAWNTYVIPGLPATPIASVSEAALAAVENPAAGSWLYFATVNKAGDTVFSDTFEQHQAAVAQAQSSGVLDSGRPAEEAK